MDYVLLIYEAEDRTQKASPEDMHAMHQQYGQFTRDVAASGRLGDCAPLEPTRTATTVRVRGGKRTVTDGPFAETREQLGGYYVVKTETEEDAFALAAKIPGARTGSIEVRPVLDTGNAYSDMPIGQAAADAKKEYILLIYEDEREVAKLDDAARKARFGGYMAFTQAVKEAGSFVEGAPLQSAKTAKTVRMPAEKRLVTDGPFAETREQLGGYYRIKAAHLDQALDIAAKIPGAEVGAIEVRPVLDLSAYE